MLLQWFHIRSARVSVVTLAMVTALGCSSSQTEGEGASRDPGSEQKDDTAKLGRETKAESKDEATLTATAQGAAVDRAVTSDDERDASSSEPEKAKPAEPVLHEVDGLQLRRLVVSEGVEEREPVDSGRRFDSASDRLYAFAELRNESDRKRSVIVTFEGPGERRTGIVELSVPAHRPRWRTWAYSRHVTEPGSWQAVVRTPEGDLLGRIDFEIE